MLIREKWKGNLNSDFEKKIFQQSRFQSHETLANFLSNFKEINQHLSFISIVGYVSASFLKINKLKVAEKRAEAAKTTEQYKISREHYRCIGIIRGGGG